MEEDTLSKEAYLLFHLNILFSSIKVEDYGTVVKNCYWPLLEIAAKNSIPINVELSVLTRNIISSIDDSWTKKLFELEKSGLVQVVESGYSQIIGPLVPDEVLKQNLGMTVGVGPTPSSFLVNEMVLDQKTLAAYRDINADRIIFEEESIMRGVKIDPVRASSFGQLRMSDGRQQSVVWASSMLFQ